MQHCVKQVENDARTDPHVVQEHAAGRAADEVRESSAPLSRMSESADATSTLLAVPGSTAEPSSSSGSKLEVSAFSCITCLASAMNVARMVSSPTMTVQLSGNRSVVDSGVAGPRSSGSGAMS